MLKLYHQQNMCDTMPHTICKWKRGAWQCAHQANAYKLHTERRWMVRRHWSAVEWCASVSVCTNTREQEMNEKLNCEYATICMKMGIEFSINIESFRFLSNRIALVHIVIVIVCALISMWMCAQIFCTIDEEEIHDIFFQSKLVKRNLTRLHIIHVRHRNGCIETPCSQISIPIPICSAYKMK